MQPKVLFFLRGKKASQRDRERERETETERERERESIVQKGFLESPFCPPAPFKCCPFSLDNCSSVRNSGVLGGFFFSSVFASVLVDQLALLSLSLLPPGLSLSLFKRMPLSLSSCILNVGSSLEITYLLATSPGPIGSHLF